MDQIEEVKRLDDKGVPRSQIADRLGLSRTTVRKYADLVEFEVPKPVSGRDLGPSILDGFTDVIDQILVDDKKVWRKQRHTAKRIWQRLRDEYGYPGQYSVVQRYVKAWHELDRAESGVGGFNELVWAPGCAQVDFGQADFCWSGQMQRLSYLVVSFPHSNMGFAQVFGGETAECVCQGLLDVFYAIGGVPPVIVFDNATGVGRRVGALIREATLFRLFRLHHRFEARFCNPSSGNEKGHVENKVGALRRSWFVPVPRFDDQMVFNQSLLIESIATDQVHYRKGVKVAELFADDQAALLVLPGHRFDPVRWVTYTTDKYGRVTVDGVHSYSVSPQMVRTPVLVGFRAHDVVIASTGGDELARYQRQFGRSHSNTVDQVEMMSALVHKPGAWGQSQLRAWMPDGAGKDFLDSLPKPDLASWLAAYREQAAASGLEQVQEALDYLAGQHRVFSMADLVAASSRAAGFGLLAAPDEGPDLSCYDALIAQAARP